jgi:Na+/proline symporter
MGLLVAAMFAASLSSLDSVYNLLAGIVAKDVYQRLFNRELSDKGLLRVGQIATLAIGLIVIWLTLAMLEYGQGAFQVMMKVASLTGTPLATPMLLGFLYRKAPSWSCMFSFLCSITVSCIFAFYLPLGEYLRAQGAWVEFSVSTFSIVTVGIVSFMISPWLFKSSAAAKSRIEEFYRKLDTPVDESTEIEAGDIDKTSIARFVGRIAFMLGGMVALFLLIPNSLRDHIVTLCVALGLLGFGFWLTMIARREQSAGGV